MRTFCKFFMCSFMMSVIGINSGLCEPIDVQCMQQVGDSEVFQDALTKYLGDSAFDQNFANDHKSEFYSAIGVGVAEKCVGTKDMQKMADADKVYLKFKRGGPDGKLVKYKFIINTKDLFQHVQMANGFLVIDNVYLKPGDTISKLADSEDANYKLQKNHFFYPAECSDHNIKIGLDNSSPVNVAGQNAFLAFGGSKNEYFLDMPVGKSNRAFPGLVLCDEGSMFAKEKIVVYKNYQEARKALKTFASNLQNTQCGNNELAVYQVSLNNTLIKETGGRKKWAIGTTITGVASLGFTAASYGISAAASIGGTVAAVGGPVGWIVGGVLLLTAGALTLIPEDLADIDTVVVLSDPEIIP